MSEPAAAGWYDDGSGRQRWWDGGAWTVHYADQHVAAIVAPTPPTAPGYYLDHEGTQRWWDGGRWGQIAPPTTSVIVQSRRVYKTSHGFHLIMSILTIGVWLPVWLVVGIYNSARS